MKRCENCGMELQDNEKFCPNCGEKDAANMTFDEYQKKKKGAAGAEPKTKRKRVKTPGRRMSTKAKTVLILSVTAMLLLLIFMLVNSMLRGSLTRKGAVTSYYKAVGKSSGKALIKAMCEKKVEQAYRNEYRKLHKNLETAFAFKYGYTDFQVRKVTISDEAKQTTEDLANLEKLFNQYYNGADEHAISLSGLYNVTVSYEFSFDGNTWQKNSDQLVLYKLKGRWYVSPTSEKNGIITKLPL